jgi:NADH-quinone oxidoreductase subunit J
LSFAILIATLVRYTAGDSKGGMGPYFWIFSVLALFGAIRVITHSAPVYSALYFVLTVFASAGLFLLLWAEFMAAALILIYAGAILITYVFVIMLAAEATTDKTGPASGVLEHDVVSREPVIASAIGFALMGVMLFVIFDRMHDAEGKQVAIAPFGTHTTASSIVSGQTQELGAFLFKSQTINLELAGLLLTIAMVGAIVIAKRKLTAESAEALSFEEGGETLVGPSTPIDDNPHSIPVLGTRNPRQKAFPET